MQRAVLRHVSSEARWFDMGELEAAIFGSEPTESERRSLRRAVAGLRTAGRVRTKRVATTEPESGAWRFTTDPPLTPEEIEEHRYSRYFYEGEQQWPRTETLYDRSYYYPEIPEGAILQRDDPTARYLYLTDWPGGTVTWFRLPKVPPRWETWVLLVTPEVRELERKLGWSLGS